MMKSQACLITLLLSGMMLLPSCRKEQDPVYPTDRVMGSDDQPLLPNDIMLNYHQERFRGQVGEPDLSDLQPPPEPEPPEAAEPPSGEGVDPTIRALIERHNELRAAQEYSQLTELYTEEYRDLAGKGFEVARKLGEIIEQVGDASPMINAIKNQIDAPLQVTSTEQVAEDTIVANVRMGMMPPSPWVFKRLNGQWHFAGQQGMTPDNLRMLSTANDEVSEQLDTILSGLKDGSIDAQSAAGQLQQSLMQMSSKIMQALQSDSAADTAEPSPQEEAPQEAPQDPSAEQGDEAEE